MDGGMITAGMATIPERGREFTAAVDSLDGQIDTLWPYFNDARGVWPTDAGKLMGLRYALPGYYFCCDDDYIYPPDYAETLTAAIDRHPGCICGFAGGVLKDPPIKAYYEDGRLWNRHWRESQDCDCPVNILMTCLCGWKVGTIDIRMEECRVLMATDIHLALAAQMQGVGMWLCARPTDWLTYQNIPRKDTIFGQLKGNDEAQTELINGYGQPLKVF